jgi:exodeoxyribonuclease VII small subunit
MCYPARVMRRRLPQKNQPQPARNQSSGEQQLATFEESLKKLESIVGQLERGDLPLEDSVKLFEEGMQLSADCKKQLEEAEGKVEILIKQRDGSMKREPFTPLGAPK